MIIPVAVYVVLTLTGTTMSSIGIGSLREDPAHPTGLMVGEARSIRSDEWLTSTPVTVGVTATGSTDDLNPLAAPQGFLMSLPSGPVSSVVLFDGTALELGPWLPDRMLIAARYWLALLLLVLAAPPFFASVTGSRRIGYLAAALITFAPATAWWSLTPVGILGFAIGGAAALQRAVGAACVGRRGPAVAWGLLSALILARTPMGYQPWAIVLVSAVMLVTVLSLVVSSERRMRAVVTIGATGALTVALLVGVLLENREALTAVLNTVYPGKRVATGSSNAFQEIFGATDLGSLTDTMTIIGTNASEISSGFAVCFVWVILLLARRITFRDRGHRAAVIALAAVSAFWFAWATMDFGVIGGHIPLANIVPSARAADIIGYLAILLFCLVLPGATRRNDVLFSLMTAGACAAVVGYAGSLLRTQNLPQVSVAEVWVSSLLVALVVFVVTLRPHARSGYALAGVLALLLVWDVNPVLVGLGDLRGTDASTRMLAAGDRARADGTVWVSDAAVVDSLFMASGVPALSGRQVAGPDAEAWARLDPNPADEKLWNRGGAFIWFEWTDSPTLTLDNPSQDVIHVAGSPCAVAERVPTLARVVASRQLKVDCLSEVRTFEWAGAQRWVYRVKR